VQVVPWTRTTMAFTVLGLFKLMRWSTVEAANMV
jgi:hypothetical protein